MIDPSARAFTVYPAVPFSGHSSNRPRLEKAWTGPVYPDIGRHASVAALNLPFWRLGSDFASSYLPLVGVWVFLDVQASQLEVVFDVLTQFYETG